MKKLLVIAAAVIAAFIIGRWAWGEAAYRYFQRHCDTQSGEFIYKTVENVEGVYQMRLRDPRDYFDRVRKGDILEDPYGHTNSEAQMPWVTFMGNSDPKYAYEYFETTLAPNKSILELRHFRFENVPKFTDKKFWIYRRANESKTNAKYNNIIAEQVPKIRSRYGFTWREIRDSWDRRFGIYGGEVIVVDLATSEELAVRRGFILWATFSDRTGICPRGKTDTTTAGFVMRVLRPRTL